MLSFLRHACVITLVMGASGLGATSAVDSVPAVADPLTRPALLTPRALQASLLGVALAGPRVVAVGERGVALFSDDNGATWQQANAPVSVTLTVVRFLDATRGWAAGHNGVVLQTTDAGASWQRILDGRDLVGLYQQQAEQLGSRYGLDDPRVLRARRQAEQLATDGPDKPWLDMHIDSAGGLWLVGAYGLVLHSRDGSQWQAWSAHLDNPMELHLYAIKSLGDEIVIAGEQGLILRSVDAGASFERLASPYKGSFFTLEVSGEEILVAGLRGHAFRSANQGRHFEPIPLPAPISVTASLRLQDGATVVADQSGNLYRLSALGLQQLEASAGPNPSALVETANGSLFVVGRLGPQYISATARP